MNCENVADHRPEITRVCQTDFIMCYPLVMTICIDLHRQMASMDKKSLNRIEKSK